MGAIEIAKRYANALYDLAKDGSDETKVFSDLRAVSEMVEKDGQIREFFHSPVITAAEKQTALKKAIEGQSLSVEVESFILLLAKKNRLALFEQVLEAYQQKVDNANGVTRGVVRSTSALTPEEREEVEDIVARITKRRVIMTYKEDPNLIGGLIAKVGSYTFDDTISSHLRRLNEDIKRRMH